MILSIYLLLNMAVYFRALNKMNKIDESSQHYDNYISIVNAYGYDVVAMLVLAVSLVAGSPIFIYNRIKKLFKQQ